MFGGFVKAAYPVGGPLYGEYLGVDANSLEQLVKGGIRIGDGYHDDVEIGFVYVALKCL